MGVHQFAEVSSKPRVCVRIIILMVALSPGCVPAMMVSSTLAKQRPVLTPYYSVALRGEDSPFTEENVRTAIERGLKDRDWTAVKQESKLITARYQDKKRSATVNVEYGRRGFTIKRAQTSKAFEYEVEPELGPVINWTYNNWVQHLYDRILAHLRASVSPEGTARPVRFERIHIRDDPAAAADALAPPAQPLFKYNRIQLLPLTWQPSPTDMNIDTALLPGLGNYLQKRLIEMNDKWETKGANRVIQFEIRVRELGMRDKKDAQARPYRGAVAILDIAAFDQRSQQLLFSAQLRQKAKLTGQRKLTFAESELQAWAQVVDVLEYYLKKHRAVGGA